MDRRHFARVSLAASTIVCADEHLGWSAKRRSKRGRDYDFKKIISRDVLDHYLSRSITMEVLLSGRGDLNDNIRMLRSTGAKYIGRSICLWGREGELLDRLGAARHQVPLVHTADPDMILVACIFEIVGTQVEQVPVSDWAFTALGMPVEQKSFRYADIAYAEGPRKNQWGEGGSVPDVSRPETKLWFYFLSNSYIALGFEAIHWGHVEIMNENTPDLTHWLQVFTLVRAYAEKHARRRMVLCNGHVPTGGLVRNDHLLLDFHAFPLRVKEVPGKPEDGILQVGYLDSIFGRSKGGITFSGWSCDHLSYLVELDNYGVSRTPCKAGAGRFWVWGYDEISWFANQSLEYREQWLNYAWNWVRTTDSNGYLEMPGSRTETSPLNHHRWYYANLPSPAVPDGLGDEVAIRDIGAKKPSPRGRDRPTSPPNRRSTAQNSSRRHLTPQSE